MISNQSTKSNDRSFTSTYDSPTTQRRTYDSPHSECSAERGDRGKLVQMITFLDQQNQQLQNELAREKHRRNEELSIIIKSLICMESKLKVDKKRINQRLLKNDTEICRLICLNRLLRKKLNDAALKKNDLFVLDALQCVTCKNKFYAIDTKDNCSQTMQKGILLNDQPTSELSSDDTVSSSFDGARRCVRYTSKRTFGTFRDYMHSRSMAIDDNFDSLEENPSSIDCNDDQNSYEKIGIYTKAIDKLQDAQRISSIKYDLKSECDKNTRLKNQTLLSRADANLYFPAEDNRILSARINLSPCGSKNNSLSSAKGFLETPPKNKFEMSNDNWYASASDGEEDQGVQTLYEYNVAVNPVLECVNQILLQQSMEEPNNDSELKPLESSNNKITKDQGNNRKRVHFSTKNSMASVPRSNNDHSQQNLDEPPQLSSQNEHVIADQIKDNILNYESIYSNEYEPIGSENNSSHLYVDMEAKLGPDELINFENKNRKQPPALPPKPANLMKFNKAFKTHELNESEKFAITDDKTVLSEPDYCSISEVNLTPTFVQVVADVHKEQHFETDLETESLISDKKSRKTNDIDHIFANIPKLSNFAPITVPISAQSKKNSPIISRHFEVISKSQRSPRQFKRKNVPNILAEINKRMTYSFPTTPTKSHNFVQNEFTNISSPSNKSQTPIIKFPLNSTPDEQEKHLPIQAEFDWYNLDVEYGKSSSNHPNINRASDVNIVDKTKDVLIKLHGVEYNLDEEFSLAGSPEKINTNENESIITLIDPGSPKTVFEEFPIISQSSPCFKLEKTASFDKFIDSSGLSTKPLPRQRKIYFAGPFV